MLKNIVLTLSLIGNAFGIWLIFSPSSFFIYQTTAAPKLTCQQAMNADLAAVTKYANENGGSFEKTQSFLRRSDYYLRNIAVAEGRVSFMFSATSYPTACGWYFPVLYGGLIRITTDLSADPRIIKVF